MRGGSEVKQEVKALRSHQGQGGGGEDKAEEEKQDKSEKMKKKKKGKQEKRDSENEAEETAKRPCPGAMSGDGEDRKKKGESISEDQHFLWDNCAPSL